MGSIASSIKETMKDTQNAQLGRQMSLQQIMGQKQMAIQMARQREMFRWIAAFTGTVSVFCLVGVLKTKNPKVLSPLLPLSFITAYQYDMAHGDKMERILCDAEHLLNKTQRVKFPNGDLTIQKVDEYREKLES